MRAIRKGIAGRLRRFCKSERGTQLVELAIVLPILLALFATTAELGRYFYSYATLAKATRAGARYLATTPVKTISGGAGANPVEDMKVKRLVVYGDPNAGDSSKPIIQGLSVGHVEIQRSGPIPSVPATVTVRIVNYNYTPLIDLGKFTSGLKWTSVPLKSSTTMRFLLTQPSPPA